MSLTCWQVNEYLEQAAWICFSLSVLKIERLIELTKELNSSSATAIRQKKNNHK